MKTKRKTIRGLNMKISSFIPSVCASLFNLRMSHAVENNAFSFIHLLLINTILKRVMIFFYFRNDCSIFLFCLCKHYRNHVVNTKESVTLHWGRLFHVDRKKNETVVYYNSILISIFNDLISEKVDEVALYYTFGPSDEWKFIIQP